MKIRTRVKRLLEFGKEDDAIDASTACRNALLPPVPKDKKDDRTKAGYTRFPTWAAEDFFEEVHIIIAHYQTFLTY